MQITEEDFVKMIVALASTKSRIRNASITWFMLGLIWGMAVMQILEAIR